MQHLPVASSLKGARPGQAVEWGPLRLGFWQACGELEFPIYKMEVTALLYGSQS